MTGYKDKVVETYPPDYPRKPAFVDPSYLALDASKIKRKIGWKPRISLKDGLHMTVEY